MEIADWRTDCEWTDGESGIWAIALLADKKTVNGSSDEVETGKVQEWMASLALWIVLPMKIIGKCAGAANLIGFSAESSCS